MFESYVGPGMWENQGIKMSVGCSSNRIVGATIHICQSLCHSKHIEIEEIDNLNIV